MPRCFNVQAPNAQTRCGVRQHPHPYPATRITQKSWYRKRHKTCILYISTATLFSFKHGLNTEAYNYRRVRGSPWRCADIDRQRLPRRLRRTRPPGLQLPLQRLTPRNEPSHASPGTNWPASVTSHDRTHGRGYSRYV